MLWHSQVNIKDLPEDDPTAALGRACEGLFTAGVEALRSVANERVRVLACAVWDLVGNRQVQVAVGLAVPTLSFTVLRVEGVLQGLVLIPKNWPQMVEEDPIMQSGALLFIGAQIVDFYNDRLVGDPSARARWEAYEAELLHSLGPDWAPNEYQRDLLKLYPDGLDTPGVDLYAFKAYEPARGSA